MVRWLFTVHGLASPTASNQSGDFSALAIADAYGSYSFIRIPKGFKAKIWAKRIGGTTAFMAIVNFSPDVTVGSPSWTAIDREYLSAAGTLELEKRRPIVVYGKSGTEGIKLSYSNTGGSGTIFVDVDVELTDEED
jgi:hypothetical protein